MNVGKPESVAAMEQARAYRMGQRAAGRARQRAMTEAALDTRAVRRALARMQRPQGRKGERASIVVARAAGEKVNEARRRARSEIRAKHSRAGVMPHVMKDPEKRAADIAHRDAWRAAWPQRV